MAKVLIVACGAYADSSYDCPSDWKCMTAAAEKRGPFAEYDEVQVIGFLKCKCPGRALISNIAATKKKVDFDAVHLSNCMVKAVPMCKNHDMENLPKLIEEKVGVKVIAGTHDFG
ncbi:CGGC domain-containing protein [Thermodesulfatator atlanticus]|uniref:CGGC domain-containing protein n=1 Tax=Thermodesulfatator atlanticus TaxID=501497 RepID=UPI0003B375E4|nr:CGGC domain-containing protein [Thermodesulfatator atlanticus]